MFDPLRPFVVGRLTHRVTEKKPEATRRTIFIINTIKLYQRFGKYEERDEH